MLTNACSITKPISLSYATNNYSQEHDHYYNDNLTTIYYLLL